MSPRVSISVDTNATGYSKVLKALNADQLPFATERAINETLLGGQRRQRRHMRKIFQTRNPRFVDSAAKILPKAKGGFADKTKRPISGTIRIEPFGGQERADIISKFEDKRRKRPIRGRTVAIPDEENIKRTAQGRVPGPLRPSNLNITEGRARRNTVNRGGRRTILIRSARGGVILQRTGRRSGGRKRKKFFQRKDPSGRVKDPNLKILYRLRPQVPIQPELDFEENIETTVRRDFANNFNREFSKAIRSSRVQVATRTSRLGGF